jgi:phosphatidate phosphatase APP1
VREWAGGETPRWLGVTAVAEGFEGAGRVRLASPEGLSVISDIDDTIKITEVPAGKRIVLRNAFLRDYHFVPEMRDRYRQFGEDVVFHYVSGSPWQLYDMLAEFLIRESEFPPGAFHMKNVRKNLLAPDSWQDFKALASGDEATLDQKVGQISEVIRNLPGHKFILVGDSGEKDPEVYLRIKNDPEFSSQIQKVIIRDVVNAEADPERLKDLEASGLLEVVHAETVVHGVSQFD